MANFIVMYLLYNYNYEILPTLLTLYTQQTIDNQNFHFSFTTNLYKLYDGTNSNSIMRECKSTNLI